MEMVLNIIDVVKWPLTVIIAILIIRTALYRVSDTFHHVVEKLVKKMEED